MYLTAMSMYNQIPDITRDQDALKRRSSSSSSSSRNSRSPNMSRTRNSRFRSCAISLPARSCRSAVFYLVAAYNTAAINVFAKFCRNTRRRAMPKRRSIVLVEAYLSLGIVHEAQTAAAVLGHNFPDSQWYKDAYGRLKGEGFEPQVSSGSWMTHLPARIRQNDGLIRKSCDAGCAVDP